MRVVKESIEKKSSFRSIAKEKINRWNDSPTWIGFKVLFTGLFLIFLRLDINANQTSSAWNFPITHFDSVDALGHLSYWFKIGELKLDDTTVIPVGINFNSSRDSKSSVLGQGWFIGPLGSYAVQTSETELSLIQPDGITRNFKSNRHYAEL